MKTFSPIDVLTGRASGLTEPRRVGCEHAATGEGTSTRGHAAGHAGLRGHSIDASTYPWRVVAGYWRCPVTGELLDRWSVVGADNETAAAFVGEDACRAAHRTAKFAKRKYPDGRRPRHLPTLALNNGTTLADL